MSKPIAALRAWFDGSWEDACLRCGMCCYEREVGEDGFVGIDFSAPCEFLDEDSRLCRVYGSVEKVGVRASRSNDADLPGI
ncbi:hypothetical protein [Ellagibacter isourolithinifaciens]|uniref:hypothetical protein n=1 Tax=Ellagibacter isourolithinifaciens TaxID=2137581 RepID=UPI002E7A6C41|nr:hypothetical protein [Ellagibacter isourolithinifaciens]MEE0045202.1 hypothetical protein [Ellagibacter isourolithinifaciens]